MLGYKRIVIADHERGLHFKNRILINILESGVHYFFDPFERQQVDIANVGEPEFQYSQWDTLAQSHELLCNKHFQVLETSTRQVGLIYKNNILSDILPPDSRRIFWRGAIATKIELIDIQDNFKISQPLAAQLAYPSPLLVTKTTNMIYNIEIANNFIGLLFVDGELKETLTSGLHVFWKVGRNLKVEIMDLRMQSLEVQGQEILTKDKVSLRINLSANYRIIDPVKIRHELGEHYLAYIYRIMQFALRQAVSARPLDALLSDKDLFDNAIFNSVKTDIEQFGLNLQSVGVKDVILPGDMKELLNRVVEAEKVAQANNIKRREETAATRSLLNTAKLMEENPILLRLKELETLEKLTEKIDHLTVFGGLDGILKDTIRINVNTKSGSQ
jgi:regulator of protease activity HflC (stomatin/prohibitin superfamily)